MTRKRNRITYNGDVPRNLSKRQLSNTVNNFLISEGITGGELNVIFINKDSIHRMNLDYRDKDKPTDVITFSMREGAECEYSMNMLGDIFICIEMLPQDEEYAPQRRVFHGVLHIAGYEHGTRGKAFDAFIDMQETLMNTYRDTLS